MGNIINTKEKNYKENDIVKYNDHYGVIVITSKPQIIVTNNIMDKTNTLYNVFLDDGRTVMCMDDDIEKIEKVEDKKDD